MIARVLNRGWFKVSSKHEVGFADMVRSLRGQSETLLYAKPLPKFAVQMPTAGYRYGKPVRFSLGIVEAVTRTNKRVLVEGSWIDVAKLAFSLEA
jgi:hypothetical protein